MTNYKDIVRPRDIDASGNLEGLFDSLLFDWIMMKLIVCRAINYFKKDDEWVGLEFDEFRTNVISTLKSDLLLKLLDKLVEIGLMGFENEEYFIQDSLIRLISDRGFVVDYVIE